MATDAELLHRYVEQRDERAFSELVQRHLGLVYSAALRRTGGRAYLAEEIAQKVFSDLARKASALIHHPAITGWLYRSTRYAAIDAVRAELRRQKLTQSLTTMSDVYSPPESQVDWEQLRPVIDEAMDQLKERDREIMLCRFFNGLTFAEIGQRLDLPENTARMRTGRALDKLRSYLGKRGFKSTTAALGMLLANQSLAAAPAGLSASVTVAALAAVPAGGIAGIASIFFMSKLTVSVVSAALAAGLTAIVWISFVNDVGAKELADLRRENARLARATATGASVVPAAAVDEFAARASAIARAMERKNAERAVISTAAAQVAAAHPAANAARHRNRGQAAPHDAFMSFAWGCDAGEIGALAKLIWFDAADREKALAVLASMPESLRAQYRTPEELYAFFFAADALVAPPPGPDVIEGFQVVEFRPGRSALLIPGTTRNFQEFQQTTDGWKYVVPADGVANAPKVLNNEVLAKPGSP
jgi:RNA polymerase sigma factor (sigma-70 family)